MTADNNKSQKKPVDSGLMCLVLISLYHQIPANAGNLMHEFLPPVKELGHPAVFGNQELILAAKSLGFRVKESFMELEDTDSRILPLIMKTSQGTYAVLAGKTVSAPVSSTAADPAESLTMANETVQYTVHFMDPKSEVRHLSPEELAEIWTGEVILLTPRISLISAQFRKFNLGWFVPSLIKYRNLFGWVLVASFLIQLFGLITPLFFQIVMDKVLVHKVWATLEVLAIGFLICAGFETVLNAVRNYLFSHTTTRVDAELGSRLFSQLISLPLAWFQARQAGQSVARVRELDSLRNFITSTALTLVIELGFTIIYFAVLWFYSSALTLVVLLSLPLYIILSVFITPILKRRLDRKFQLGAVNQSFLVESLTGVETIKSLALEPQMQKRWENMLACYVTAAFRAQNFGQLASQAANFFQKLTLLLIIWFGVSEVMDGVLTVGQLVAFNMIAGRISGPILKLTQLWQDFQQAGISLKRLGDILNTRPEQAQTSALSSLPKLQGGVTFDHVNFRYPPNGQTVVNDLSFEVAPGEIIGLVGQSGSGKSTLARLIQRFYQIESGRILIDGTDLALADTVWLRKQIGVVLQDNVLFSGTVRENIAMANPGLPLEKVIQAAKLAGAHDFIAGLREGYDTQVGERGGNLSGGQRQRLAIARILIGDPRILIFDEATSALDYESEKIIQDNMALICEKRTVFIIAHRLSALRKASRIFVLDQGRLAESGTPFDLYTQKGAYYQMVKAQSSPAAEERRNDSQPPKPDH
jgi:subfamily B ATP-binding cassette protein HlyB/CyaB